MVQRKWSARKDGRCRLWRQSCLAAMVYCSAVKLGGCHLGRWRMELLIINKHLGQSDA